MTKIKHGENGRYIYIALSKSKNKSTDVPRLTSEHLIFCGESIHGLTFNRLVLEMT